MTEEMEDRARMSGNAAADEEMDEVTSESGDIADEV